MLCLCGITTKHIKCYTQALLGLDKLFLLTRMEMLVRVWTAIAALTPPYYYYIWIIPTNVLTQKENNHFETYGTAMGFLTILHTQI